MMFKHKTARFYVLIMPEGRNLGLTQKFPTFAYELVADVSYLDLTNVMTVMWMIIMVEARVNAQEVT